MADREVPTKLGDDARASLPLYAWPGNVRELRNAIRRAVLLRRQGVVQAADIRFGQGDNAAAKLGEVLSRDRLRRRLQALGLHGDGP